MEHSLCVSEDSGPSSGGAAQRGCNGKSCSLFLKIRTTCCGRMCGGDLDDADAEGLGKVNETVRERARRHAQDDTRAWARRRAPRTLSPLGSHPCGSTARCASCASSSPRTLSPLGGHPCGSTARCASCASSSQIHRSARRQGGILRRYETLLRLKNGALASCAGQRAVFPRRRRPAPRFPRAVKVVACFSRFGRHQRLSGDATVRVVHCS
jgi:hypothetical protein